MCLLFTTFCFGFCVYEYKIIKIMATSPDGENILWAVSEITEYLTLLINQNTIEGVSTDVTISVDDHVNFTKALDELYEVEGEMIREEVVDDFPYLENIVEILVMPEIRKYCIQSEMCSVGKICHTWIWDHLCDLNELTTRKMDIAYTFIPALIGMGLEEESETLFILYKKVLIAWGSFRMTRAYQYEGDESIDSARLFMKGAEMLQTMSHAKFVALT